MVYVQENKNMFSFKGVIGQGNFLINHMMIIILNMCLAFPFLLSSFLNGSVFTYDYSVIISNAPSFALLLYFLSLPIGFYFIFANLAKRIADIRGKSNTPLVYLLIAVAIPMLSVITGILTPSSLGIFSFLFFLFIAAIPGKITAQFYDEDMHKFNWGAFWGTWIWGLVNKVPFKKTFWAIPAFFVGVLPFVAIIFGLKGNEWAYNAKKYEDIDSFHDSQSNQGLIWTLITPVLWVLISFFFAVTTTGFLVSYSSTPSGKAKIQECMGKFASFLEIQLQAYISKIFDDYKHEDGIYKFYIKPSIWVSATNKVKIQYMTIATEYLKFKFKTNSEKDVSSLFDILKNVKIYSSYNNELLGEFNCSLNSINSIMKKTNSQGAGPEYLRQLMQQLESCYNFDDNPLVP